MQELQQLISSIGVPAIVVILILREVLPAMRGKSKNGELVNHETICREEFEKHKDAVRYSGTCDKIHEGLNFRMDDFKKDLGEIKTLIRNGHQ